MTVSIRRAGADDADFLVELVTHADVEPFLAVVGSKDRDEILAEIARSNDEAEAFGVFVIEVDGELAGTMRFTRANQRSRIADQRPPSQETSAPPDGHCTNSAQFACKRDRRRCAPALTGRPGLTELEDATSLIGLLLMRNLLA